MGLHNCERLGFQQLPLPMPQSIFLCQVPPKIVPLNSGQLWEEATGNIRASFGLCMVQLNFGCYLLCASWVSIVNVHVQIYISLDVSGMGLPHMQQ